MAKVRFYCLACMLLALSACSIENLDTIGTTPTLRLAESVKVIDSKDAPLRTYVSSDIKLTFASYHMETVETQPPETGLRVRPARATQLFVTMTYATGGLRPGGGGGGLIDYDSAHDQNGNALVLVVLERQVFCRQGCRFTEELVIELPERFIEANVQTGFQVVVRNKLGYGDYVLDVPPNYVTAHIMAYRALTKNKPGQNDPEIEI